MDAEAKWILAAGVAAAAVLGIVVYEKNKAPVSALPPAASTPIPGLTPPAGTTSAGTFSPVLTFVTGQTYEIAGMIPGFGDPNAAAPGSSSAADLANLLQQTGWSNVNILFWGPANAGITGSTFPQELTGAPMPFGVAGAWAARATWNGANGTPVPAGYLALHAN
jgi:hypothetical protein